MRPWVARGWHGGEIFSFRALFRDSMDEVEWWLNFERSGVRHRRIEPSFWLESGASRSGFALCGSVGGVLTT
jgi:hypothetical protein